MARGTEASGTAEAIVVPAGAPAPKFQANDRLWAPAAKVYGRVTGARWQDGQWVYELRYEVNGAHATWFESQMERRGA